MELSSKDQGDTRIVSVMDSRIDAAVAIQFKDLMRDMVHDAPERVVLDLSRVTFVDSSGLGAIVAAMKQSGETRKLELAGLTRSVQKVFSLTRMDRVFTIHKDVSGLSDGFANAG